MNFSHKAQTPKKTKVCLKYFVNNCRLNQQSSWGIIVMKKFMPGEHASRNIRISFSEKNKKYFRVIFFCFKLWVGRCIKSLSNLDNRVNQALLQNITNFLWYHFSCKNKKHFQVQSLAYYTADKKQGAKLIFYNLIIFIKFGIYREAYVDI